MLEEKPYLKFLSDLNALLRLFLFLYFNLFSNNLIDLIMLSSYLLIT